MRQFIIGIIATIIAASCSIEDSYTPEVTERVYERVLFVYIAGDNSLDSEVEAKLEAIESGAQQMGDDQIVVAFVDSYGDESALYQITNSESVLIKEYGIDLNAADGQTFEAIVEQVVELYKAQKYGMLVFSHASGWLPQGALTNPTSFVTTKSIMQDGSDEMEIADFVAAIPSNTFDYIIFESCYMASVEVVYALRNKADYIVASSAEVVSPGFEEIYPSAIQYITPLEPDLQRFAQEYFDCWSAKSGVYQSATISLLDTSAIDRLAECVKQINSCASPSETAYTEIQYFNRSGYRLISDFGSYIDSYAPADLAAEFQEALDAVVIYKQATQYFLLGQSYDYEINAHSGLTTYIPQASLSDLNSEYYQTEWYQEVANDSL